MHIPLIWLHLTSARLHKTIYNNANKIGDSLFPSGNIELRRNARGRAVYTALHGARLSSVPSGDQSANPASVPGRSGFQRALLSVSSAQKCSGAGRLATPSGVPRAASSPAGSPLQGTELAALSTPETSLERLVPLVDYSAAWNCCQMCLDGSRTL